MRILLIGANGLLGHNVARQLLFRGYAVKALLRKPDALHIDHPLLERCQGSFLDPSRMRSAAQGCDAIINCAGCTDMSLLRFEDYLPANRDGLRSIASAMEEQGIRTLIHISTANTIGYGTPDHPTDETAPMQSPFSESFYAQSKKAGEEIVDDLAQRHPDWHIVTLHPGFMLGPCDWRNSSGRLLKAAYRKPLMLAPKGGKSFVSVEDAAVAIVNALTMGTHARHYLITGHNMSLKEFYRLQAQTCGYRQLILSPPNKLMLLLARIGDALRWLGIGTQLSTRNVRQLLVYEYYDNRRAQRELALPQSPLQEAIRAYFDYRGLL